MRALFGCFAAFILAACAPSVTSAPPPSAARETDVTILPPSPPVESQHAEEVDGGARATISGEVDTQPAEPLVHGARMDAEALVVDGMRATGLACEFRREPAAAAMFAIVTLAAAKDGLAACKLPSGARIAWEFEDDKVQRAKTEDAPPAASKCVDAALRGAPAMGAGKCSATLVR